MNGSALGREDRRQKKQDHGVDDVFQRFVYENEPVRQRQRIKSLNISRHDKVIYKERKPNAKNRMPLSASFLRGRGLLLNFRRNSRRIDTISLGK
jgi:hypothetical protein